MGMFINTHNMNTKASSGVIKEMDKYNISVDSLHKLMIKDVLPQQITKNSISQEQLVNIIEEKAKDIRVLNEEHSNLLAHHARNKMEFDERNDLPYNIDHIIEESKILRKYKISIVEYRGLTKTELYGALIFNPILKKAINWNNINITEKKEKFYIQTIRKILKIENPITSPSEAVEYNQLQYQKAAEHYININTAEQCSVIISDVKPLIQNSNCNAGADWFRLANEAFIKIPANEGISKEQLFGICDQITKQVPDINKYFKNHLGARNSQIKSKAIYLNALEQAGIILTSKQIQVDGVRNRYYFIKIGTKTE
jgi:hypothetical protein